MPTISRAVSVVRARASNLLPRETATLNAATTKARNLLGQDVRQLLQAGHGRTNTPWQMAEFPTGQRPTVLHDGTTVFFDTQTNRVKTAIPAEPQDAWKRAGISHVRVTDLGNGSVERRYLRIGTDDQITKITERVGPRGGVTQRTAQRDGAVLRAVPWVFPS